MIRIRPMPNQSDIDPKLIYVVDDNQLLGQVTAQIIETCGFRARYFVDGLIAREAIIADSPKPGVVVTDYDLGPIVGFEIIETARREIPGVKCLLVSGTVKPEVIERHPTQPEKFIPKPFKADELLAAVKELAPA